MKGFIGEFEELVLLTIACLGKKAYGVAIKDDIDKRTVRSLSLGALHTTITRLEEKVSLNHGWVNPHRSVVEDANASLSLRTVESPRCII